MYFLVKYIDYEEFKKCEGNESLQETKNCHVSPGINKELIVNPDCFIGIILDYVYNEVGIDDNMRSDFDLSTEKAKPINIATWQPDSNGLSIFNVKATYYIVYRGDNNQIKPLLNKSSKEYSDFVVRQKRSSLSKKSSSLTKSVSRSTTSKSTKSSAVLPSVSREKSKSARSIVS